MAIHDWTRVYSGTFHDFHARWITHLAESLNESLLPPEYFALSEQHAGAAVADVLTLSTLDDASSRSSRAPNGNGSTLAVAEAPPKVELHMTADAEHYYHLARRTLAIRHRSSRRLVAMIEILSPGNKDSQRHLDQFVEKAVAALQHEIHLLIIDLFPPGSFDPRGIHGAIWEAIGEKLYQPPSQKPLTLAAYVAEQLPQAYVQPLAVGDALIEMPLFLEYDRYVPMPLEPNYSRAYRGVPAVLKDILEGRSPAEQD